MYYKYLTAKETISSDQRRVIEQAKYTYSYLKKPLKTNNNHWRSRKKQIEQLKIMVTIGWVKCTC